MATKAQLDAALTAAYSSMSAGNFDAAIVQLEHLKLLVGTYINATQQLPGGGAQSMVLNPSFSPAAIDETIANCRRMKAEAAAAASTGGPWQTTKVTYARPTS